MRGGRYLAPEQPGYSAEMKAESLAESSSREAPRGSRDRHADAAGGRGADRGGGRGRAHLPARAAADRALERRHRRRGRRPARRPALEGRAGARRGRVRDPRQLGRGARRPGPPRAAPRVGPGPQRRRRRAARRRARARPRRARRLTVTTSSGVHAGPLAEFAIFGLLAFAKDLPKLQADQRERHWPPGQQPVGELRDRTLLLVGVGAIGTETARLASAFGMHVIAVKRSLGPASRTSTSCTP